MMNDFRECDTEIKSVRAYEVYKHCMYLPTKEKYDTKVEEWLKNENIKVFAYYVEDTIKGILVILLRQEEKAEIIGISVNPYFRGQGVGSYMIHQLMERYQLKEIFAETDDDAIGFYVRNGFEAKKQVKTYDDQDVVRYCCVLRK